MKLLIADDSAVIRKMLAAQVTEWGFTPVLACDGEEAWSFLIANGAPCLVLLDWEMPKLDGVSLIKRIRDNEDNEPSFIIMLTSRKEAADVAAGLDAGANDYVGKPCDFTELKARLCVGKRTLELQQQLKISHQQLLQSEKMASVGKLAAGVAHEINTPVGYMKSNMAALKSHFNDYQSVIDYYEKSTSDRRREAGECERLPNIDLDFIKSDTNEIFTEATEGLNRVRDIVRSLLSFAGRDGEVDQKVDLHELIDQSVSLSMIDKDVCVQIKRDYGDIPPINCVPYQMKKVFINLLVNAMDAVGRRGEINIRTFPVGHFVGVDVEDNGEGINPTLHDKVFEPFFTTKDVGYGSGLGLSESYGIVSKHGGDIKLKSNVGQGTRIRVFLPTVRENVVQC